MEGTMVRVNVSYEGDLRCRATHEPSQGAITTDAPVDNHGKGEAFSPTDLIGTSLATCMATIMGIFAQRREISLQGLTVEVDKHMTSSTPRRIERLDVRFNLPLPSTHEAARALQAAAMGCPVHHALTGNVELPVTFQWNDGVVTRG